MSVSVAARFCERVSETPEMSNATARVAAWLIGVAMKLGGFPLSLSMRQVCVGFERDGMKFPGTGCRMETVKASLQWLEDNGLLESTEGERSGFGHHRRNYTIKG